MDAIFFFSSDNFQNWYIYNKEDDHGTEFRFGILKVIETLLGLFAVPMILVSLIILQLVDWTKMIYTIKMRMPKKMCTVYECKEEEIETIKE